MALNGGRVGRPVFFFSTQQIDLPVGTSARRRNSSRQLTITFVQSSEGRLGRVEGTSVTVAQGAGRSYGSLANSDAPRWCSVVPRSTPYQQLYLSPRRASTARSRTGSSGSSAILPSP